MAKTQTFADKARGKQKAAKIAVKVVKTYKNELGNYKFHESFVQLNDISKVSSIK